MSEKLDIKQAGTIISNAPIDWHNAPPIKLALGSGKRFYGEDWIHIDNAVFPHTKQEDIFNLPYKDVDVIYACHLIAYCDREEVVPLLKHWYDILKPGGMLRIATPDFEVMAELYLNNNCDLQEILGPLYGRMQVNNDFIYHKTCWDYLSLLRMCRLIGFKDPKPYDYTKTEHASVDDHSMAYLKGELISLNIEATK